MDFKQQVYDIISQFSGQNNVITVNIAYVDFTGDIETALFLSQVIYWTDRTTRKDGFFYKTDEEWREEIRLSRYAIRKARKKLEEMGILETKVKKANGNPTVHYRLDKHRFVESFISFLRNQKNENANSNEQNCEREFSLTKTTTKNTTEITTNSVVVEKLENENDVDIFELLEMMDEEKRRGVEQVYQFYQNHFGIPSSYTMTSMNQWINDLSPELVLEALKITYKDGKTWKYTEGILRNWAKDGITSLNDLEKQKEKKSAPRRRSQADVWNAFNNYINSLGDEEDE
jgi:DnaD/phage-associated family protein